MFSISSAEELRQQAQHAMSDKDAKDGKVKESLIAKEGNSEDDKISEKLEGLSVEDSPGSRTAETSNPAPPPSAMTTEQIELFFNVAIDKLKSAEVREEIKGQVTDEMRIPAILIKIQHEELESMGFDRQEGQAALNGYAHSAMNDRIKQEKMEAFSHTCQRTFIEVLRDMQPEEMEKEKKMTPSQVLEFFEACNTLMALPETKATLREEFLQTKNPPDETIVKMQRSMLRTLGFEPDHGVACLNSFPQDYPEERQLQGRMQFFMRCSSMARQEAMIGKEEMRKQAQMQQVSSMKEQQMMMELNAMSPEEKEQLVKRAAEIQRKHAKAVMAIKNPSERTKYILSISEKEQWEMAKLQMLTFRHNGSGPDHGQSCAHGEHCHRQGHMVSGRDKIEVFPCVLYCMFWLNCVVLVGIYIIMGRNMEICVNSSLPLICLFSFVGGVWSILLSLTRGTV
ncbi:unnamed protein product [Choristocarpus tenellus]